MPTNVNLVDMDSSYLTIKTERDVRDHVTLDSMVIGDLEPVNHVKMNVKLVLVVLLVTLVMMDTSIITDNVSKSVQTEDGQTPKLTDVTHVTQLVEPVKDQAHLTVPLVTTQDT
jgi:hypothetical protein